MLRTITGYILLSSVSAFLPCMQEFNAVDDCHKERTECSNCKILAFSNPFAAGFCGAVEDSLCNALGCCESCDTQFAAYEKCLEQITFGGCAFDCETAPTPVPTPAPTTLSPSTSQAPSTEEEKESLLADELEETGCLDKFGVFAACAVANPLECGACFVSSIPDDVFEDGFCPSANNLICGFGTCCEPCLEEFIEFDDCFEDIVESVTFGTCEIDCDNFEPITVEDIPALDPLCVEKITTYTDCIAENPIECAACAVLSFPLNPQDDGFCEISEDTLCGFSQCCSSCETQFQEADECLESWISLATFGQCEIDCDTYETNDSAIVGCGESFQEYTDCVANYPLQCATCFITNLPDPAEDGFCQSAGDSVCGFGNCCAPCSDEFLNFDECFEMFTFAITLGECQLDCDSENASRNLIEHNENNDRALRGVVERNEG